MISMPSFSSMPASAALPLHQVLAPDQDRRCRAAGSAKLTAARITCLLLALGEDDALRAAGARAR